MSTILDAIAAYTRVRVEADKEVCPLDVLIAKCREMDTATHSFYDAICKSELSFICEIKKASPSKGIISEDFPYLAISRSYEEAGADAISCLTEPKWFLGSDKIFEDVRKTVKTPMLRKDFVVDSYQLYQAKLMGADAVLLICSLLNTQTIVEYLDICAKLGLDVLVEAHDETEIISAVDAGAKIIGVNNRNLKDFSVDFYNAARLRERIPAGTCYVAESGVTGPENLRALKEVGADAVLIGEALMRAKDKNALLCAMREACQ
ncbi:MAG TPA: indole-3-glycerol phosphate synthase TrpC [Clostridiales bacterium]|jgi:indole-3-glycerol phosphate synthase|nr:indole-3-glycerol phosphate synthase TrpC [Clostridiales bacterium]